MEAFVAASYINGNVNVSGISCFSKFVTRDPDALDRGRLVPPPLAAGA
jgi:hypothetical protein